VLIQQLESELRRQRLEMDRDAAAASPMTVRSAYSRHSQVYSPSTSQYDLNLLFGDQTSTIF